VPHHPFRTHARHPLELDQQDLASPLQCLPDRRQHRLGTLKVMAGVADVDPIHRVGGQGIEHGIQETHALRFRSGRENSIPAPSIGEILKSVVPEMLI
jgi:hypothetical protein